jgi:O-antigen/teichoic acid export membrane protein
MLVPRVILRNTGLNIVGRIVPLLVSLATLRWVLKGLGIQRFGLLMLLLSVISSVGLLDFGTNMAITKLVAETAGQSKPGRISSVVWTGIAFQVVVGLVGACLLALTAPVLALRVLNMPASLLSEATAALRMIALGAPITIVSGSFRALLEGLQCFDYVNLVALPSATAIGLAPIVGIALGYRLPGIVGLLVAARVFGLLCYCLLALRIHLGIRTVMPPDREAFKSLLAFGGYIAAPNLFRPLTTSVDRVILTRWAGLGVVAYYSTALDLLKRLGVITSSWASAALPAFSRLASAGENDSAADLYERCVRLLFILLGSLLAIFTVVAPEAITLWLGRDFAVHTILPLRIMSLGILLAWVGHVPMVYLRASGAVDMPFKIETALMPIELAVLLLLTRFGGLIGASIGTAIGLAADPLLLFVVCYSAYGLPRLSHLKHFWTACCLMTLGTGCLYFIHKMPWPLGSRLLLLVIGAALMELAFWHFALEDAERSLFKRIFFSFNRPARALRAFRGAV